MCIYNLSIHEYRVHQLHQIKQKLVHDTQSAQQAQSMERNTYKMKSLKQYNVPILLNTAIALGNMATLDGQWRSSTLLVLETTESSTSTRDFPTQTMREFDH